MAKAKNKKAIRIIDLKEGDEWSGKIQAPEDTVDGDSITYSFVKVEKQTRSLSQLAEERAKLLKNMTIEKAMVKEIDRRIAAIVAKKK